MQQERDRLKELQKTVSDLKEEIVNVQGKLQKTKNMKDALHKKNVENVQKMSALEDQLQDKNDQIEAGTKKYDILQKENVYLKECYDKTKAKL